MVFILIYRKFLSGSDDVHLYIIVMTFVYNMVHYVNICHSVETLRNSGLKKLNEPAVQFGSARNVFG